MFELQIVLSSSIIESGVSNTTKTRTLKAARGKIYDCNGTLLAYNKLSYNVVFTNTDKVSKMTSEEKNSMIYRMIRLIEKNGDKITVDFFIDYDDNGNLEYTVSGNTLYRYIAEAYGINVKQLTQDQKDMTPQEMFDFLRSDTSSKSPKFNVSDQYDDATALQIVAVRYAMFLTRFQQYESIVIAKDVSEKTVAVIKENASLVPGVDIDQDTTRVYKKSKYFAHMLGYTGAVSAEKLAELQKNNADTEYTTDDQIGISGLESTYEDYLKGTKGKQILTLDGASSRIVNVKTDKNPVAGNDLYLTIDAKLQEECYRLLEEHLAGILISNINNSADAGTRGHSTKEIRVPIYDVYNALINNNIIDVKRFTEDDASALEKATYKKYQNRQKTILRRLKKILDSESNVTFKNASSNMGDFLDCFYQKLKDKGVVLKDEIDTDDGTYKGYTNGSVSLSKYLQYAISKQWIDLEKLNIGDSFFSTQEIYQKLVDYGLNLLENDTEFVKMVYSYLIYHYELSGRDCCLLLFDQGDIKFNETEYTQLKNGVLSPYSFLIRKIKKLEITPGDLGLDPCSGSLVVTDVNTGEVKAMVTYPSYDNNRMANQVDSEYFYNYLTENSSSPLLNRPTQQEIAPGSTFKVISSVTALEDGILTPSTQIYDGTVFNKVYGNPRCWSTSSHGNLTVATAIEVSCNYFFYEVGYRLSGLVNGRVNDNRGLARIKKYAEMFGLTDKSGVEVTESTPHFSTEDAVRSAIGQANHAYAPIQMARYVTTVANSGTCYDLTLVDKIKDVDGKTILNNKAKVRNKVKIAQSTWNAVHKGMYLVVNGDRSSLHGVFNGVKKTVAGKTGTAQQNTLHPNHANFISYAPYENPKISVTCIIPNGYASANAAETASDVYRYYFSKKKVSGGKASSGNKWAVTD